MRRNAPNLDTASAAGSILVAERASPDDVGRIIAAAGTLSVSGAVLSHVSLLSREFGRPSVALGASARARLLPAGSRGLLELWDVVGLPEPPRLEEEDVLFLDGDRGVVRIPGALSRSARAGVRGIHATLVRFARDPGPVAAMDVVERTIPEGLSGIRFLLEAALLARLVPSGEPSRSLLAALAAVPGFGGPLADQIRMVATGELRRLAEAAESVRLLSAEAGDLDELDVLVAGLERDLRRARGLIEDLGAECPADATSAVETALEAARDRRRSLVGRIAEEIEEIAGLPAEAITPRLGGLFRLARRARAVGLESPSLDLLHSRLTSAAAEARSRVSGQLVVPIAAGLPRDRMLLGGKASALAGILPVLPPRCHVPRGFVITSAAYRLHRTGEVDEKLREAVAQASDEADLSRRARAAVLGSEIPEEVRSAVAEAHRVLLGSRLAVRSSATIEDGPSGSFAGLCDTFLGVTDLQDLLARAKQVWASLWSARALRAMSAIGRSPLESDQAVLVQEMVEPRTAGTLLSRDPAGRPGTLLVNAWWGLGEAIARGEADGDLYWVRKDSGRCLAMQPGSARTRLILDPMRAGTVEIPLPPDVLGLPCLDEQDLGRLAELARELERATGRAQDVEFGFDRDGRLVLFQARRVVTPPTA